MNRLTPTRYTNEMIVYALLTCLFQVHDGSAAPNQQQHALVARAVETVAETTGNAVNSALGTVSSSVSSASDMAKNAVGKTGYRLSSLFSNARDLVQDFGSETTQATENGLRAVASGKLAVGKVFNKLLGGVLTVGTTGNEYLAGGTNWVHELSADVPVVRVVTGGLNNFMTEFSKMTTNTSTDLQNNLRIMFDNLDKKLIRSGANGSAAAASSVAGADSAPAAAVSEAAPATK